MHITQKKLLPYEQKKVFAVIDDIDSYYLFLPYCTKSQAIRSPVDDHLEGLLEISVGPFTKTLKTLNRHQYPSLISIHLKEGPVKYLNGYWRLTNHDGPHQTLVEFELDFEFESNWLSQPFEKIFKTLFDEIVSRFEERLKALHGMHDY